MIGPRAVAGVGSPLPHHYGVCEPVWRPFGGRLLWLRPGLRHQQPVDLPGHDECPGLQPARGKSGTRPRLGDIGSIGRCAPRHSINQPGLSESHPDPYHHTTLDCATASALELMAIAGHLVFITRVRPPGRAFLRRIYDATATKLHVQGRRRLPHAANLDLRWWFDILRDWSGILLLNPTRPHRQLWSDALTSVGMGAHLGPQAQPTAAWQARQPPFPARGGHHDAQGHRVARGIPSVIFGTARSRSHALYGQLDLRGGPTYRFMPAPCDAGRHPRHFPPRSLRRHSPSSSRGVIGR